MPALVGGHYVTYVMNFKRKKYEYLTSLKRYTRIGMFKDLGDWLTREARAGIDMLHSMRGSNNTQTWNEWGWDQPTVQEQPDKICCGIFMMKLLEEWNGPDNYKEEIKSWETKSKLGQIEAVKTLRIRFCLKILSHKSNNIAKRVQNEAQKFILKKFEDLKNPGDAQDEKKKARKAPRKKNLKCRKMK